MDINVQTLPLVPQLLCDEPLRKLQPRLPSFDQLKLWLQWTFKRFWPSPDPYPSKRSNTNKPIRLPGQIDNINNNNNPLRHSNNSKFHNTSYPKFQYKSLWTIELPSQRQPCFLEGLRSVFLAPHPVVSEALRRQTCWGGTWNFTQEIASLCVISARNALNPNPRSTIIIGNTRARNLLFVISAATRSDIKVSLFLFGSSALSYEKDLIFV